MSFYKHNSCLKNKCFRDGCEVDKITRKDLWDAQYFLIREFKKANILILLTFPFWTHILEKTFDEFEQHTNRDQFIINEMKKIFLSGNSSKIFDIIEISLEYNNIKLNNFNITNKHKKALSYLQKNFITTLNNMFERNYLPYRVINEKIIKIESKKESEEISKVFESSENEAIIHINTAIQLYSNRKHPDYRNSIKESISAVEALCRKLTGKNNLGDAIKYIKNNKILNINDTLLTGLEKIYGFTCGYDGIRHSIIGESKVEQEDAKFMLVICSAFINYIIRKNQKTQTDFKNQNEGEQYEHRRT